MYDLCKGCHDDLCKDCHNDICLGCDDDLCINSHDDICIGCHDDLCIGCHDDHFGVDAFTNHLGALDLRLALYWRWMQYFQNIEIFLKHVRYRCRYRCSFSLFYIFSCTTYITIPFFATPHRTPPLKLRQTLLSYAAPYLSTPPYLATSPYLATPHTFSQAAPILGRCGHGTVYFLEGTDTRSKKRLKHENVLFNFSLHILVEKIRKWPNPVLCNSLVF